MAKKNLKGNNKKMNEAESMAAKAEELARATKATAKPEEPVDEPAEDVADDIVEPETEEVTDGILVRGARKLEAGGRCIAKATKKVVTSKPAKVVGLVAAVAGTAALGVLGEQQYVLSKGRKLLAEDQSDAETIQDEYDQAAETDNELEQQLDE